MAWIWMVPVAGAVLLWAISLGRILSYPGPSCVPPSPQFMPALRDDRRSRNVLLVVAHPDDESMFFAPTILFLKSKGHNVHILCMSQGNADGLGNTRKEELYHACDTLKIPHKQVKVLDHPKLQDGFHEKWDHGLVSELTMEHVQLWAIDTIVTFDSYGVSGHPNHKDVHHGICEFLHSNRQGNVQAWELVISRSRSGRRAAAMPPSIHGDEDETTPLVGDAQAAPKAAAPSDAALAARTRKEEYLKSLQAIEVVPPAPFPWWRRLPFLGPTRDCVAVGQPLLPQQIDMLRKSRMPGYFKQLSLDRELVTFCLADYNSKHQDKYEFAPGKVTKHYFFKEGICLAHGNFVARPKCFGWLSYLLSFLLPVPRTLFFFEISSKTEDSYEVVTCSPLAEPVTESNSVLGFPLGFSKRRSGELDKICRTCFKRFSLPYFGIQIEPPCGHSNVRNVCEMCFNCSIVLHPVDFKFGNWKS